jgi:hypothetical protein
MLSEQEKQQIKHRNTKRLEKKKERKPKEKNITQKQHCS